MAIATINEIRAIGNLDSQVEDSIITVNLASACRELQSLLNMTDYSSLDITDVKECEACLTMARLVSLFTIRFKFVEKTGILEDVKNLKEYWEARAMKLISKYKMAKIRLYTI